MYKALDVAKYIVSKCTKDESPISNLQLQKILFYIQKSFLNSGGVAFQDSIEAWQFGPVVPNVYYHYCGYGAMPIDSKDGFSGISETERCIIDKIVEEKRRLDPWDLVNDTHKLGGAWDKIYNGGLGNHGVIPNELIRAFG